MTTLPPDPGLDDEEIGGLVRDVTHGWTMPPQRLGHETWRDRIGRDAWRLSVGAGIGSRLRRVGRAAAAAVAATIALALVAVWLTALPPSSEGPHQSPGSASAQGVVRSASPSTLPTREPTAAPTPTPLPRYALYGTRLAGRVIAQLGGTYEAIDLESGASAGSLITGTSYGTRLFRRASGDIVCACQTWSSSDFVAGTLAIEAQVLSPDGALVKRIPIVSLVADADPGAGPEEGHGAVAAADLSPDGGTLYVGWAYRTTPVWHSGITVVDIAHGQVVQTRRLADSPSFAGGAIDSLLIQSLRVSPDGAQAMLSVSHFVGPTGAGNPSNAYVLASLARGRIANATVLPDSTASIGGSGCPSSAEDWATSQSYFVMCPQWSTFLVFDLKGQTIARTDLGPAAGSVEPIFGGADVVDRKAALLYHWDPSGRTLVRVDLATGRVTGTVTAPALSGTGSDSLADVGRTFAHWLAPSVAAKTFLQPGIAISPDGTRIYAIGIAPSQNSLSGSTGVDVFDTRGMTHIDHWAPLADLVSIATSPDGRNVYVAGAPGATASGSQSDAPASLIVYDAVDGHVHLVAGDIGSDYAVLLP